MQEPLRLKKVACFCVLNVFVVSIFMWLNIQFAIK